MDTLKFNEEVSIGAQPNERDLQSLKESGFRSIVNLRADREPDQPLSPGDEGDKAAMMGMEYLHFPVTKEVDFNRVDQFRNEYSALPKPAFVHCAKGARAGMMVVMEWAAQRGLTGDLALDQAEKMGFTDASAEQRDFIKRYCDQVANAQSQASM